MDLGPQDVSPPKPDWTWTAGQGIMPTHAFLGGAR